MTKRRADGWAGIVDVEDEASPTPERSIVDAPVAAPPPRPEPRVGNLKLPIPNAAASKPIIEDLELPAAGKAPSRPQAPAAAFSGELFADRIAAPLGSGTAAPAGSVWKEYREVIVTFVIGVTVLGGSIAWRVMNPSEPEPASERSPPLRAGQRPPATAAASARPAPTDPTAPPIASTGAPVPPTPGTPPRSPVASAPASAPPSAKAVIPMLSIITFPAEADVEINDEFVGRSPLIVTAAPGTLQLNLRVSKEGHEPAQQVLRPNDGGHFSATVTLKPKKK